MTQCGMCLLIVVFMHLYTNTYRNVQIQRQTYVHKGNKTLSLVVTLQVTLLVIFYILLYFPNVYSSSTKLILLLPFLKDSTQKNKHLNKLKKKWLELVSEPVKLQDTKVTQKSVVFLYTNNNQCEKKTKETIPFTLISIKKNKICRTKLNQGEKT